MEQIIIPKTQVGVKEGNKLFGAGNLRKSDISLVMVGTNGETENPLHHGEISALNAFFAIPESDRPAMADCYFLATHEPCSLCLSETYQSTKDANDISLS